MTFASMCSSSAVFICHLIIGTGRSGRAFRKPFGPTMTTQPLQAKNVNRECRIISASGWECSKLMTSDILTKAARLSWQECRRICTISTIVSALEHSSLAFDFRCDCYVKTISSDATGVISNRPPNRPSLLPKATSPRIAARSSNLIPNSNLNKAFHALLV